MSIRAKVGREPEMIAKAAPEWIVRWCTDEAVIETMEVWQEVIAEQAARIEELEKVGHAMAKALKHMASRNELSLNARNAERELRYVLGLDQPPRTWQSYWEEWYRIVNEAGDFLREFKNVTEESTPNQILITALEKISTGVYGRGMGPIPIARTALREMRDRANGR